MKKILIILLLGILFLNFASAQWTSSLNSEIRSFWKLNETGTGVRVDSVGFKNGTLSGGAMNTTSGKISNGAVGDGTNRLNFTNVLTSTDTISLSAWIQKSGVANNFNFRWLGDTSTNQVGINYNDCAQTSQDAISVTTNSVCTNIVNSSVAGSGYRHVVIVAGADISDRQLVYIDGVLITNKSATAFTNLTNNFVMLDTSPNSMFVDEVGLWTKALTTAEVTALYNGGSGATFTGDIAPSVTLNYPTNNSVIFGSSIFNATVDSNVVRPLVNATINIWLSNGTLFNQTTTTITGTTNVSSFNITNLNLPQAYKWNVYGCNTFGCSFASNNFTFTLGDFTEEFQTTLIEGQSTGVNLNITFDGINQNILAILNWNNTQIIPTKNIINSTRVRFTSNFIIPVGTGNSTGRLINHNWRFYLSDNSLNSTTTTQQQTVYSLGFDNCTSFSNLLLNYTMYDEDAITLLNGTATNGTIEVGLTATSLGNLSQVTNFSRTYNQTNNARVCVSSISSGFRIDAQARYYANNYVVEFYNIQNSTLSSSNFPQHIGLYPLLSSRSQEFLVTYKDINFLPVEDALITVTRKYVGEGIFRTVEAPLTNEDGQALVHLVLSDLLYTIIVSKNGDILGTFDNIVPFCTNVATGDCSINLNSFSTGISPEDFTTRNNLSFAWSLNKTTRTISNIFTTTDGSVATVNLTSIVFDNRGNNTACSTSLQTSSGTIDCVIPASVGNTTIIARLYKDGSYISQVIFSLGDETDTGFGSTGIIMFLLLYITIPLMMISSGGGIVIGAIMGMIFGAMLNLFDGGSIIGVTSTVIWFIIAGAIIIWKINKERQG